MYSILIVDDEPIELETLAQYIPWDQMDIEVAGTAKNGREGLALAERLLPDIILTDVRMPIMDGLEFASRVKRLSKPIRVVFLSGHDEFHYIKAALSVEATGYLLKPVDLEELAQLMEKVKRKCDEARLTRQSAQLLREKALRTLLLEASPEARRALAAEAERLPLALPPGCAVAYLALDRPSAEEPAARQLPEPLGRSIGEALGELVRTAIEGAEWIQLGDSASAAILPARGGLGPVAAALADVQRRMAADFPVRLTIGLSQPVRRPEELHEGYASAREEAGRKFYAGVGSLLVAGDAREPVWEEIDIEGLRGSLIRSIGQLNSEEASGLLSGFFKELRSRFVHHSLVRSAAIRLLLAVQQHFAGGLKDELEKEELRSERIILHRCETLDEIEAHAQDVCHLVLMALSRQDRDRHTQIVRQIEAKIGKDYAKPLTVEDLAKEVFLSPNYVRTIVKEKTGRTILDLLTETRMKRAAELLADPSLKVHEVAGRVGYENVSYFCSIFQKTTGATPNNYRKQIR